METEVKVGEMKVIFYSKGRCQITFSGKVEPYNFEAYKAVLPEYYRQHLQSLSQQEKQSPLATK